MGMCGLFALSVSMLFIVGLAAASLFTARDGGFEFWVAVSLAVTSVIVTCVTALLLVLI